MIDSGVARHAPLNARSCRGSASFPKRWGSQGVMPPLVAEHPRHNFMIITEFGMLELLLSAEDKIFLFVDIDLDRASFLILSFQNLQSQRILNIPLDGSSQRPHSIDRVIASLS